MLLVLTILSNIDMLLLKFADFLMRTVLPEVLASRGIAFAKSWALTDAFCLAPESSRNEKSECESFGIRSNFVFPVMLERMLNGSSFGALVELERMNSLEPDWAIQPYLNPILNIARIAVITLLVVEI